MGVLRKRYCVIKSFMPLPAPCQSGCSQNRHLTSAGLIRIVYNLIMTGVRTILALLIALSVALLPAAGVAGFKFKSQEMSDMSADEPMDDCCPHAADLCDKAMNDCASMAACALHCLSFSGGAPTALVYPLQLPDLLPLQGDSVPRPRAGSPPFRPPRT